MKKLLFIGFNHRVNDPRLFFREIKLLKDKLDNVQIYFVTKNPRNNYEGEIYHQIDCNEIDGISIKHIRITYGSNKGKSIAYKLKSRYTFMEYLERLMSEIKPSIIQASDARELFAAHQIARKTGSSLIYDSHEDYVRQVLDFGGSSILRYFKAFKLLLTEVLYVRFYDYVFCTDEFLLEKYRKRMYRSKSVNLLRNYPYITDNIHNDRDFKDTNTLKLVYIGGVNEHRGVIECANYVEKYNLENENRKLVFDVYARNNEILEELVGKNLINHHEYVEYNLLMEKMNTYDVGICLWLPIKKFYRNLPLKNFDYMKVGLPILTSNFGNLKRYIDLSNAGLVINPLEYQQFKDAMDIMFNSNNRKKYSINGLKWVKSYGSFQKEGMMYCESIRTLLGEGEYE